MHRALSSDEHISRRPRRSRSAAVAAAGLLALALTAGQAAAQPPADNGGANPADGPAEAEPCPTTTTLPPAVAFAVVDPPPEGADDADADPCASAEEPTPEPTTTTAPSRIDAADDAISVVQGETIEPFDVTDNDSVSPSVARMAIVSGRMPSGLTLWVDSALRGYVIGTPEECGTFSVEYSIDASSRGPADADQPLADTATVTVEVACGPGSAPLAPVDDEIDSAEGTRLEIDLVANDEPSSSIVWIELTAGDLPGGTTVWAGGWLTGTPTESGTFEFSYTVHGIGGATAAADVVLTVAPASP